jgi:outer membrane lipoprotein LolB
MHSDGRWLQVKQGKETSTVDLNNPDEVTTATGWDFPLKALPYWIKGLPSPSLKLQRLVQDTATGGASVLEQAGWEVRYEQYRRFEQMNLPTRIVITDGEVQATVLVKQWRSDTQGHLND